MDSVAYAAYEMRELARSLQSEVDNGYCETAQDVVDLIEIRARKLARGTNLYDD